MLNFLEFEALQWKSYNFPQSYPNAICGTFLKIKLIIKKNNATFLRREMVSSILLLFGSPGLLFTYYAVFLTTTHLNILFYFIFYSTRPIFFQGSALCLFSSAGNYLSLQITSVVFEFCSADLSLIMLSHDDSKTLVLFFCVCSRPCISCLQLH